MTIKAFYSILSSVCLYCFYCYSLKTDFDLKKSTHVLVWCWKWADLLRDTLAAASITICGQPVTAPTALGSPLERVHRRCQHPMKNFVFGRRVFTQLIPLKPWSLREDVQHSISSCFSYNLLKFECFLFRRENDGLEEIPPNLRRKSDCNLIESNTSASLA